MKKYVLTVLSLVALPALADTLTIQGVGGTMDAHSRSPILTVNTERGSDAVIISADAYVKHSKYVKYPIRYQFFINRELVSTQFSSPELPGTARIGVDEKIATVPFNYTVIADLIYPNRTFSSVVQGAVENELVKSSYNCNLTTVDPEGEVKTSSMVATAARTSASSFGLAGNTEDTTFSANLNVFEGALSGTMLMADTSVELNGTSTLNSGLVESFNVVSADGSVTLGCE